MLSFPRAASAALCIFGWFGDASLAIPSVAKVALGQIGTNLELSGSKMDTCDVTSDGPICFAGGRAILSGNAIPDGLVGHWTFDGPTPIDDSGRGHHTNFLLTHGPSPAGVGHSVVFSDTFMLVESFGKLNLTDFSYSFWIYLPDDARAYEALTWCPLLLKGVNMPQAQEVVFTPALFLNRRTGQLRASLSTSATSDPEGEFVESNARVLPNRWMHIALVHHAKHEPHAGSLLMYVNGILDAAMKTEGTMAENAYPLYVGGDPFTIQQCKYTVYMDELRAYSRAVAPHELQAEASPSLGGVDPSFVHLGCRSCPLQDAIKDCPKNRHICTSLELHTGGYQVARALGWLQAGSHVWTHTAVMAMEAAQGKPTQTDAQPEVGLGLCCEGPA